MADIQTEKAFKKQDGLNLYNKYLLYGEEVPTKTVVKKKKDQAVKRKAKKWRQSDTSKKSD